MVEAVVVAGKFQDIERTVEALDELRAAGISDEAIEVMSSIPYPHEVLGRPAPRRPLPAISLTMACIGVLVGIFFTFVTPHLYVVRVGGQPIVPPPPTAVLLYEFTMAFLVLGTFLGLLWVNLLPAVGKHYYDPSVTDGGIALFIRCSSDLAGVVRAVLESKGAENIHEPERRPL